MSTKDKSATDSAQSEALMVVNAEVKVTDKDVGALVGSNYWTPLVTGFKFQTGEDGKLVNIPRSDLRDLAGSLDRFNSAWGWWVGDLGNAIRDLYGDEELALFFTTIKMDPTYGRKLMGVARDWGYPGNTGVRHPGVPHMHHWLLQGLKDQKKRSELLQRAFDEELSQAEFSKIVKREKILFKKGPGALDDESAEQEPEYSAFVFKYRAFRPGVDNEEQYAQEIYQILQAEAIPGYLDPDLGRQIEEKHEREKAVEGLPELVKTDLLKLDVSIEEFRKAAIAAHDREKDRKKIIEHATKVFDPNTVTDADTLRAEFIARADQEQMTFDAFKTAVKEWKQKLGADKQRVKSIDKLASKIKNDESRNALLKRAQDEGLSVEQFEPLVKRALAEELTAAETARIEKENKEAEAKKIAQAAAKMEQKAEKMLSGGKKAATTQTADSELALPKKGKKPGKSEKSEKSKKAKPEKGK